MRGRALLFTAVSLLSFLSGCRKKVEPAGPVKSVPSAAVTSAASAPASASASASLGRATSAAPLLAMRLDADHAAIFLEETERTENAPGALIAYAKGPILAFGHAVDGAVLSAEARAHVEDAYVLHAFDGRTCDAVADGFAVVHRIPADDPTASRNDDDEATWIARVYGNADKPSRVALVHGTGCGDVRWATPKSQPSPATLAVAQPSKAVIARTHAVIAKHEAFADVKKDKPTFEYATLGDALVWARAKGTSYAGAAVCFVVTNEAKPRVVTTTTECPPGASAASRDASATYVWFENAVATMKGDVVDVTYFPTAYFGIAEGF